MARLFSITSMMEILEDDKGRVKALAAGSSRDTSTSKPYNDLLSHKSNSTPNQLRTLRQDTNEEEDVHIIYKDEVDISMCQHQNLSEVTKINKDEVNISVSLYGNLSKGAKMQHEFGCKNQEKKVCRLKKCSQLQPQQKADQLLGKAVHNLHEFSQENGIHSFEQNLIPFGEQNRLFHPENQNQYPKLQQMNNLKTPATEPGVHGEGISFDMLLQRMIPHLDKDKVMQLQTLPTRSDKKEISKDDVKKNMRTLVGGQMVTQATYDELLMEKDHTRAWAPQNSQAASQKLHAQCENSLQKQQQRQQVSAEVIPTTRPLATETNIKTPLIKPSIGLKKPLKALRTPSQASKKQKVTGAFLDQSIEQFDDVTAVCGVNLMEEEAQLLPVPKEEHRASEATRRGSQEKEEMLILQKVPFLKKMKKITSDCGIKKISKDVERCLSLCLEERMRGLVRDLIRASKQRVDTERSRHPTIVTSDVRRQLLIMNRKAKEDWEEKQAEKLRILNETKENTEDKVETHGRTLKENIESKRIAANAAARAATGVDDIMSRWQSIAPLKRKQNRTPSITAESRVIRKCGKNRPGKKVARRISVEDVINVMEREPRMSKSTLLYRLYERRI